MTDSIPDNSDAQEEMLAAKARAEFAQVANLLAKRSEREKLLESPSLIDALGVFLSDLDHVHGVWLGVDPREPSLGESGIQLRQSRDRIKQLMSGQIVPPPGQTKIQYGNPFGLTRMEPSRT